MPDFANAMEVFQLLDKSNCKKCNEISQRPWDIPFHCHLKVMIMVSGNTGILLFQQVPYLSAGLFYSFP